MSASINKLHISLALAMGIILGSSITFASFHSETEQLNTKQTQLRHDNEQLRFKIQQLKQSFQRQNEISTQASVQLKQQVISLNQQLDILNTQKQKVEKTLIVQQKKAVSLKTENKELTETKELQDDLYDQSHELFEKQMALKEEIDKLSKTREKLAVQNKKFIEDCKLFKEGTSWDAKSDSCDKQKMATVQLGKLDSSIAKKKKELIEMNKLIEKLGVNS